MIRSESEWETIWDRGLRAQYNEQLYFLPENVNRNGIDFFQPAVR